MPTLTVELNGHRVSTLRREVFLTVTVRVLGCRLDDKFATLSVATIARTDAGDSIHLTWIHDLELTDGQTIAIGLGEQGETAGASRTIDELYPEGPGEPVESRKQKFERSLVQGISPWRRDRYAFEITPPCGPRIEGSTLTDEHCLRLLAIWPSRRADLLHVRLGCWTLHEGRSRSSYFREDIQPGQPVQVRLGS